MKEHFWLRQELKESLCLSVRPSVCPAQVFLEQSIFIFLSPRALIKRSENSQRALKSKSYSRSLRYCVLLLSIKKFYNFTLWNKELFLLVGLWLLRWFVWSEHIQVIFSSNGMKMVSVSHKFLPISRTGRDTQRRAADATNKYINEKWIVSQIQ